MCDEAVDNFLSTIEYVPGWFNTQKLWYKIISEYLFAIRHVSDQYKTRQMSDKAVDDCQAPLKSVSGWFVLSKMIKNFLLLCTQMIIYPVLINILVMLYFVVMEWTFMI